MPKRAQSDSELRCSFCHKAQEVVGKLICSPSDSPRAYICDECIAVCNSIIEDDRRGPKSPDGTAESPDSRNDLHLLLDQIADKDIPTVRKMLLGLV